MSRQRGRPGSALAPYRVIDFSEGGFNWCGKVLADLGADVIKVEPTEGSSTRDQGPFIGDEPGPDNSLFCGRTATTNVALRSTSVLLLVNHSLDG